MVLLWLVCLPATIGALVLQHVSTLQVGTISSIRAGAVVAFLWLVLAWLWPQREKRTQMVAATAVVAVLDADALNALGGETDLLANVKRPVVLTPHHFHDGEQHHTYFFNHFLHKGIEAAKTCADTLHKVRSLRRLQPQQKIAV